MCSKILPLVNSTLSSTSGLPSGRTRLHAQEIRRVARGKSILFLHLPSPLSESIICWWCCDCCCESWSVGGVNLCDPGWIRKETNRVLVLIEIQVKIPFKLTELLFVDFIVSFEFLGGQFAYHSLVTWVCLLLLHF